MAISEKDKGQRRVYVLPAELVDRIVAYQLEMGLQSEVEAARRLLDEALKRRDDWRSIANRVLERLKQTRVLSDIASDVLVGHPLVEGITFAKRVIRFTLTSGEDISVSDDGILSAFEKDEFGAEVPLRLDPKPPKKTTAATKSYAADLDDDIPF